MFQKIKSPVEVRSIHLHRKLEFHSILDLTKSYNNFIESKSPSIINLRRYKEDTRFGKFLVDGEFKILYFVSREQYLKLRRDCGTGEWFSPLSPFIPHLKGKFITIKLDKDGTN